MYSRRFFPRPLRFAVLAKALLLVALLAVCISPASAVTVRGFVKRAATGQAAALVDLDAFDVTTGASVFLLNDKTGVDGFYQIVLNPGTYDITYTPPVSLRLAGYRRASVVVSGGSATVISLPDTLLEPGLSVTGHVQDSHVPPNPVPSVEVRFFDAVTRQSVFVPANITNASGDFSVFAPARTYDLIYAPAAGSSLLPVQVPQIVVSTDRFVPTVSLAQGVLLEGDVRDPTGAAVADVDADLFDAFTGDVILTVRDDTDVAGHFRFAVPIGIVDIDFFPPAGPPLAAQEVRSVVISGPAVLPPVVLPAAVTLSGRVVDGSGSPVTGVDLDLIDLDSGRVYPTARDDTDLLGQFAVNVPPGLFDVRFEPAVGAGLASAMRPAVALSGNMALPDTTLPAGRTASGRLLDAGVPGGPAPVVGATFVVFDDITGAGFPAVAAPSAADGTFSLLLPPGRWVIEPLPPRGSPLTTRKLAAVDLTAAPAAIGDVLLSRGVSLSGRVLGPAGPVRDVDIDVIDALGARLITPRDNTDPLGNYSVVVPDAATYALDYEPPRSTDLAAVSVPGVLVSGPTLRPDVVLQRGVVVTGRVVDLAVAPVFNVDLNVLDGLGRLYLTPHDHTLSTGRFKVVLPPPGDSAATIQFSPARGSRLLFSSQGPLDLSVDTDLGDIPLASGALVSGRVSRPDGTGVRDVDLNVFDADTRISVRTPHDTTDGAGDYIVAVPPAIYNIQYLPPPPQPVGDRLLPARVAALTVASDVPGVDVTLQTGVWVKGRVERGDHSPVASADLDFIRSNGTVEFTPQGRTGLDGVFSLAVSPDTYTLRVAPAAGEHLLGAQRAGVGLLADTPDLPSFVLYSGYFLEGFLFDASFNPVDAADLDVIDPVTGQTLFTPGDNTDPTGFFHLVVPPGIWDLRLDPPATANLPSARRDDVIVVADTLLPDTILSVGFRVEGQVYDSGVTPVPGAEAVFLQNGTVWPAAGNIADISGRFRTILPGGTYTVVFTPPAGSGLAPLTRAGTAVANDTVLADAHLSPAQTATLSGVAPGSGTAAGGSAVVLSGTGFVPGARVFFGGVEGSITSLSPTSINAILPSHPPGPVDVAVVNPGSAAAVLADGFTFLRRPTDIDLRMSVSGEDLVLTWTPTGQPAYTVFRAASAAGLRDPLVAGTAGTATFTIVGGTHSFAGTLVLDVE